MTGTQILGPHSAVLVLVDGPAVGVSSDATLQQAARAMRDNNVSAVVVDDGRAIVTERDLACATAAGLAVTTPVDDVMVSDPITINPAATIIEAAAVMIHEQIRHLVVRDDDGPVAGVVSLRAVLGVLLDVMEPSAWVAVRYEITKRSEIWLG